MIKKRSIRFKLTFWFTIVLAAVAAVTLLAVRYASGSVLRGTIRDHLIGTVEENVNKIKYTRSNIDKAANNYIPYEGGYLEIDTDFMDVVNDVYTALYTEDGSMLYGENPLSRVTSAIPFTESHTWSADMNGVRYDIYDRKLNLGPESEGLWIRGIVPEAKSAVQLREITRLSLILLPILVFICGASGYLLADKLLSPIRRIESTASEIAGGDDLKKRIDTGGSSDEVGRLAAAFNTMLDRLDRSFEAERQFTSDASHELRTPTSVIMAQCEYTLEKDRSAEEYEEALRVIQKQSGRMSALIGDMLDYTRMEQRSEMYPMSRLDLSDAVLETVQVYSSIDDRGISLSLDIADGIEIQGNRMLISRLIQNLVDNAFRYGRDGGHVEVSLHEVKNKAVLSVSDDGIGIADEEKEKIFDRFYRSDSSRSVQGTGLGLSFVKKAAELHGAAIELESQLGTGSTFRIFIPK